ncbi:MAG: hypothetical protein ABIP56_04365 [Dokdonella sp.]
MTERSNKEDKVTTVDSPEGVGLCLGDQLAVHNTRTNAGDVYLIASALNGYFPLPLRFTV